MPKDGIVNFALTVAAMIARGERLPIVAALIWHREKRALDQAIDQKLAELDTKE